MPKDITIIGNSVIDVLARPCSPELFQSGSWPAEEIRLSFGGDAQNEAVILSRLGKQVELISKTGADEAGQRIRAFLEENGVSPEHVKAEEGLSTSVNLVLIDAAGERYFITNPAGSQRRLSEADITPYLDGAADIVSFASIFVSSALDIPAMTRLFRRIKSKAGRLLACDITKAKHGERLEDLKPLLPYIDYIFPNEAEIALLTGCPDPLENAARLVRAGVQTAVVKTGAQGCLIKTADSLLRIPAWPAARVVDTTGAGDSFAAGFLYGLSEGFDLRDCGFLAAAAASCTIEAVGATDGLKSADEVWRRFRSLRSRGAESFI